MRKFGGMSMRKSRSGDGFGQLELKFDSAPQRAPLLSNVVSLPVSAKKLSSRMSSESDALKRILAHAEGLKRQL
jgi:hypothetical protein